MDNTREVHIHIHLDGLEALVATPKSNGHARKPAPTRRKGPAAKEVREWALAHDVPVSKTGKIAKSTFEAYAAAH